MWQRIGKNGNKYWGKKAAGIFFTDGSKVLLLKRSKKGDSEGTWGLPGGKVEEDETLIDAARREAKEECGHVEGSRFADLQEKDGLHDWTTFFFKIKKPFDCVLSDEHTDYKWVDLDSISNYELHPKLKENLDRHLNVLSRNMGFKEWLNYTS